MRTIAVLQPSYLPWIGYFDQIIRSDYFIFLDDVAYTKNDWRNRNRIKSSNGPLWLTVPVSAKHRITNNLLIKDVHIADTTILTKHLKSIALNYKKAEYFNEFFPLLEHTFTQKWKLLTDLNIAFVDLIIKYLAIKNKKFYRSSELILEPYATSTERLVAICKKFEVTDYLTGDSANSYLDTTLFKKNGIAVTYQHYQHPVYTQLWGEFVPYLSVIDLLFNEGKNSFNIISNANKSIKKKKS